MPIHLDYDVSRSRFQEALDAARTYTALPSVWLERTKKVGESPSKTFIAMLGTALLAKATDPRVDPFALKARDFPIAYSARSLCKDVLVPCAVHARVHLGTTGREPLNNQPFFRHEQVGPDMKVRPHVRPHLDYLCECLAALRKLDQPESLAALAAFLRVRADAASGNAPALRVERVLGLPYLVKNAESFISSNPEAGKRGQALVAAALDLVLENVRTTRVFDPSRRWPGDVVVYENDEVTFAVEVKQRPATESEILQFVERCAKMTVHRAMVAILHPRQPDIDVDHLRTESWNRCAVHLSVLIGAGNVLRGAFTWTPRPLRDALREFPQLMARRLEEMEASVEGRAEWAKFFSQED